MRAVSDEQWRELTQAVRDTAEGYASTDPGRSWAYRDEADRFCRLDPPATAESLAERRAEAATLRRAWRERLNRRNGDMTEGG